MRPYTRRGTSIAISQTCVPLTVIADSLLWGFVETGRTIVFYGAGGSRHWDIRIPNPLYTFVTPALRYLFVLCLSKQQSPTPSLLASIAVSCPCQHKGPSTLCSRRTTVRGGRPLVPLLSGWVIPTVGIWGGSGVPRLCGKRGSSAR